MKKVFRLNKALLPLLAIFILGAHPSCVHAQEKPAKSIHIRIASGDDINKVILDTIVDKLDKDLINKFLKVSGSDLKIVDVWANNGENEKGYFYSFTTDGAETTTLSDYVKSIGDDNVWTFTLADDETIKLKVNLDGKEGENKNARVINVRLSDKKTKDKKTKDKKKDTN